MADLTIHTYTAAEGGLFVNSYLLETPAGVVVVDTNLLISDIAALTSRLAALHKPLLGIFITHAHPDHFNGALELVRDREVPVHATSGVARVIREVADAKRAQWRPVYGAEWPTETYYPNTELDDGHQVMVDGLGMTASELGPRWAGAAAGIAETSSEFARGGGIAALSDHAAAVLGIMEEVGDGGGRTGPARVMPGADGGQAGAPAGSRLR